jgi:transposase
MAGEVDLEKVIVDSASVRGKKGAHTQAPSPVDRGKRGCKRHIITTGSGLPLLVTCTPANIRDDVPFLAMLDTMPPVKMPGPGAPRYKPRSVVGDAGYGFDHIIPQVIERRIRPLLAPRGQAGHPVAHGSGLGRVRYVVERTIAWLANFRRINPRILSALTRAHP